MPTYCNIGGAQKEIQTFYARVGGVQKELNTLYANVGGAKKTIFKGGADYYRVTTTYNAEADGYNNAYGVAHSSTISIGFTNETIFLVNYTTGILRNTGEYFVAGFGGNRPYGGNIVYYSVNSTVNLGVYGSRVIMLNPSFSATDAVTTVWLTRKDSYFCDGEYFYIRKDLTTYYRWKYTNSTQYYYCCTSSTTPYFCDDSTKTIL